MAERRPPLGQHTSNEKAAVAIVRSPLAAEQRESASGRGGKQLLDRRTKLRRFGHRPVESMAFGVVLALVIGATAQRIPLKVVVDPSTDQSSCKLLAIELRGEARKGIGAHVYHGIDAVLAQQALKVLE